MLRLKRVYGRPSTASRARKRRAYKRTFARRVRSHRRRLYPSRPPMRSARPRSVVVKHRFVDTFAVNSANVLNNRGFYYANFIPTTNGYRNQTSRLQEYAAKYRNCVVLGSKITARYTFHRPGDRDIVPIQCYLSCVDALRTTFTGYQNATDIRVKCKYGVQQPPECDYGGQITGDPPSSVYLTAIYSDNAAFPKYQTLVIRKKYSPRKMHGRSQTNNDQQWWEYATENPPTEQDYFEIGACSMINATSWVVPIQLHAIVQISYTILWSEALPVGLPS